MKRKLAALAAALAIGSAGLVAAAPPANASTPIIILAMSCASPGHPRAQYIVSNAPAGSVGRWYVNGGDLGIRIPINWSKSGTLTVTQGTSSYVSFEVYYPGGSRTSGIKDWPSCGGGGGGGGSGPW